LKQQGHDRCHYYPDIFISLLKLFKIDNYNPNLPKQSEFKKGCEQYQKDEYFAELGKAMVLLDEAKLIIQKVIT